MSIRDLTESTPFTGDYTGRDWIGHPSCSFVYRYFRGTPIKPVPCIRYTKSKRSKYCHLHDTKAKRFWYDSFKLASGS